MMTSSTINNLPVDYSTTGTGKQVKDLGKQDFLKLLTTQMQNQDPLEPMKNEEFIAQLAQFNALEQMTNLNTTMEGISSMQMMNLASGLLGHDVEASTSSGTITGKAQEVRIKDGTWIVSILGANNQVSNVELNTISKIK